MIFYIKAVWSSRRKKMFVPVLFSTLLINLIQARLIPFGADWNRPYPNFNLTVNDYVKAIAVKTGESVEATGLNIHPLDYSYQISEELLGVKLKGSVHFKNGIITHSGKVVPSVYAAESNRSTDLSEAFILFAVRLDQLDVTYELETKLEENNVDGSVEVSMKDVDFFFVLTHKFATSTNSLMVNSVSFFNEVDWKIMPRSSVTYAVETITKRRNDTNQWYENSLIAWQKDQLGPMIVQQAQDLPFPIRPN